MSSKKAAAIKTAFILYSVWLVFYLVCEYFDLVSLPESSAGYAFMAAAVTALIIAGFRIEELQYSPFILIIVFALGGRLVGFVGNLISLSAGGNALFMLPFGRLDVFLFEFLMLGLFRYSGLSVGSAGLKAFHPASLIPLALFAAPVLLNLLPGGMSGLTAYSFVFTAFAVWLITAAINFGLNHPGKRQFAAAAVAAVIFDMFVYLDFTPLREVLPPDPGSLLMPYALLMLAGAVCGLIKEEVND